MKAVVYAQFGSPDVLQLTEVGRLTPMDDEVLVRVHAASVNFSDPAFTNGKPFAVRLMGAGFLKPKNRILGADIAGRVEAIGSNARQFRPCNAVFGDISECGWGGFAEYVWAQETALAEKPADTRGIVVAALALVGELFALLGFDVPLYVYLPILPFELFIGMWLMITGIRTAVEIP
jgi:NADPH:quinone reductase-like Zn-dependent oxidoreductase